MKKLATYVMSMLFVVLAICSSSVFAVGAKLPVLRSERLFFHPARMTSRFLADYAESLICRQAQLADVAEAFGIVRDSA
jgi:hypothetical protein